jgi:hypothetical protein
MPSALQTRPGPGRTYGGAESDKTHQTAPSAATSKSRSKKTPKRIERRAGTASALCSIISAIALF